jgi:hypothetical protein
MRALQSLMGGTYFVVKNVRTGARRGHRRNREFIWPCYPDISRSFQDRMCTRVPLSSARGTDECVKNDRARVGHTSGEEIVCLYGRLVQIFQDLPKTRRARACLYRLCAGRMRVWKMTALVWAIRARKKSCVYMDASSRYLKIFPRHDVHARASIVCARDG